VALAVAATLTLLPARPAFGDKPSAGPLPAAAPAPPAAEAPAARLPEAPPRANYHPIVLVHGFLGFAENGPAGFNYWGGRLDLAEELRARGYPAYAAAVGPASSNWDRACELYAAIRGGRVDYGQAHALAAGHQRFGRTYPGLLPDWGETRPVHLVGHSMGGLTCRLLVQLLEEGDTAERAATPAGELSPLFAGGHSGAGAWVRSVTTLASPHDGTPAAYYLDTSKPALRRFAAGLYYRAVRAAWRDGPAAAADPGGEAAAGGEPASSGSRPSRTLGLDLHLEAWGLEPAPGECLARFRRRFAEAENWWRSRDTGIWDGTPQGARELNLRVAARPDVYYFSWATEQSTRDPLSGRQVPEPGMSFLIYSLAAYIGGFGSDPAWWPNDGIVSTCSMDGPTLGSADRIVAFSGEPRAGVWNFMGLLSSCDHLDLIGLPWARARLAGCAGLPEFYTAMAALLAGLPK
jgi:triacylglycerol lipase